MMTIARNPWVAVQEPDTPSPEQPIIPEQAPGEPDPYPVSDPNPEPAPFPTPPEPIPQYPPDVTF